MESQNSTREFNFNRAFSGLVINNEDYENTNEVDIIIKELIMVNVEEGMEFTENINTKNLLNINDLRINKTLINSNYITCKPLVHNVEDEHISRPEVGEKVLVYFYNGNPKMPYFKNIYLPYDVVTNPPSGFTPKVDGIENNYYRIIRLREDGYLTGKDIDTLAEQLNNLGYKVDKVDNKFVYNKQFRDVVMQFQHDHGLRSDGVVDPITFTEAIQESRNMGFC